MNRIKIYILSLFSLLLLFNCTKEESTIREEDRLYIHVATTAFAADGVPSTKAVNTGFLTTFENGDAIGVTGIDANGNILDVCNNVKFNYKGSETINGVIWANFIDEVHGYSFVERVDGAKYFAYYPYSEEWNGKKLNDIISAFEVQTNQSTKENFDKSDLMATDEPIAPVNSELQFIMHHKMTTISIFYNNEYTPDGTPLYKILLYDDTKPDGLRLSNTYRAKFSDGDSEENGKYELRHRYLLNPATTNSVKLVGCLEEKSYRYFSREINNLQPGVLYSVSFEGEPLVPYTDGVDLELDDVEFEDKDGNIVTLGHTVIWSKYNLGESLGEEYPFPPLSEKGEKGGKTGSRDPYARGDYYCWGATFTQYDNGLTGYHGYGYNNYFDKEYKIAPLGGTIKETEYDVAHAKWWRGKWRLPTENEFRAMYAGCTFEKVDSLTYTESQYRYIGRQKVNKSQYVVIKVTSKQNGNSIYFSSGGYFDGTLEPERDENGNITSSGDGKLNNGCVGSTTCYYLSSTASPKTLKDISYAFFTAGNQQILTTGSRYTGMLVRPVYSPNEK